MYDETTYVGSNGLDFVHPYRYSLFSCHRCLHIRRRMKLLTHIDSERVLLSALVTLSMLLAIIVTPASGQLTINNQPTQAYRSTIRPTQATRRPTSGLPIANLPDTTRHFESSRFSFTGVLASTTGLPQRGMYTH